MEWWADSVPVVVGRGKTVAVNNPRRAAEILLYEWPGDAKLPKHRTARAAVLKALENAADAKASMAARRAFDAAVKEAGIRGAGFDRSKS